MAHGSHNIQAQRIRPYMAILLLILDLSVCPSISMSSHCHGVIGTPGATSLHRLNEDSTSVDFEQLCFDVRRDSISLQRGSTLTHADHQALRLAATIRETLKGKR